MADPKYANLPGIVSYRGFYKSRFMCMNQKAVNFSRFTYCFFHWYRISSSCQMIRSWCFNAPEEKAISSTRFTVQSVFLSVVGQCRYMMNYLWICEYVWSIIPFSFLFIWLVHDPFHFAVSLKLDLLGFFCKKLSKLFE